MNIPLTLAILILYLTIILTVGIISSRKIKSTNGYYLAERSLGWFAITATITATVVGGSATIASAKLIYLNGLPSLWLDIGAATGLIILGIFLAKKVRETKLFTLPEITNHLYNEKVRYVSSILIIITQIAWISLLIQATGAVITVLLPVDYTILLSIITIIFIFYTLIGGQYAVVYTDIIQFIIMVIGVCCIATPLLFMKASPQIFTISSDFLSFPINKNLGFLPIVSFFFMMTMPHIVGPDIYSKILSAKNEKTARNGCLLAGGFRLLFAISIAIIGLSSIILVPNLSYNEAVFAMPIAITQLGPFLAGPILAAFISIMLSSADSVLLSAGTVLSVDITKKKSVIVARAGILIIGVLSLLLALYLSDIIETLKLAYTVFTSGLTFPIIFGFYKNKTYVTSTGALLSLFSGGLTSLVWFFLKNPYNIDAIIIGMLCSLIPLIILRKST
jgi:SSS family solute:Na+ symporter